MGMTAALALARRDIPVCVLEAAPALVTDLRGSTFHPPTLEMLSAIGVGEQLIAEGLRVDSFQFRERTGGIVADLDLGLLKDDTPFPFRLQCPQHRLTAIILDHLKGFGHAEVHFGHAVVGVEQDAEGVTALVETGGGPREVRGAQSGRAPPDQAPACLPRPHLPSSTSFQKRPCCSEQLRLQR